MPNPYASALVGDPTIAQAIPKSALAQMLMQQSTDTSPIRSPWQGVARMAQALAGAYMQSQADAPYRDAAATLKQGLAQGTGTPAETWHNPGAVSSSADGTSPSPIDYQQLPEHAAPGAQDVSYGGTPGDIGAMLKTLGSNPIALERGLPLAQQMLANQQATQKWNMVQPILADALRNDDGSATGGSQAGQSPPTNIGAGSGGNMPTPAPGGGPMLASNAGGPTSDGGGAAPTMAATLAAGGAPSPMGGAPASGGMAPAPVGGGAAPQGGGTMAGIPRNAVRQSLVADALGSKTLGDIVAKNFPGPTEATRALLAAGIDPRSPQGQQILSGAATAAGGTKQFIGGERPGVPLLKYDPATGNYGIALSLPQPIPGTTIGMGPDGKPVFQRVPGATPNMAANTDIEQRGKARYEPQTFIDPNTGAQSTTNRTALASGKALPTALAPETQARLSGAGAATYEPQTYYGPGGQAYQGTRASLPAVGGVAAPPPMGDASPSSPQPLAFKPAGAGGPPSASGGPPPPNPAAVTGSAPAASATPPTASGRLGPAIPVQTPGGPKDISDLSVNDLFPGGEGIPTPPKPPPGMGYGPPNEAETARQKADASRLEEYAKQASANPKIYQDLAHLQDVLGRGLNTSNVAPAMKELATTAQALGYGNLIPKGYDPNDAATFQKAATDLVFESVKKLAGQVKVAEIEGYKQASPNVTIPVATNYSILGDLLANGKWQDARAKLGQEYATKTGGAAPLSAFDAKFNAAAPLPDVTDTIKDKLRQAGARFPGDPGTPSGGPVAAGAPNLSPAIEKQADDISVKFHSGAFGDPGDPRVKAKVVDMLKKLGP